ncbi:hypothetical protein Tco_1045355 [Tanacetum coccineum]|uniref:Uncharacterized protein n=1 Tax=Tanacetum coccineum TaxID=301880 RepID=A0ABQ5GTL8_9ASTR
MPPNHVRKPKLEKIEDDVIYLQKSLIRVGKRAQRVSVLPGILQGDIDSGKKICGNEDFHAKFVQHVTWSYGLKYGVGFQKLVSWPSGNLLNLLAEILRKHQFASLSLHREAGSLGRNWLSQKVKKVVNVHKFRMDHEKKTQRSTSQGSRQKPTEDNRGSRIPGGIRFD